MSKKSWTLTIKNQPLTLTLTPPPSWGYCYKCEIEKPIRIISQHPLWVGGEIVGEEERKFCQPCALDSLQELENGDYEVKQPIIEEVRSSLIHV
jgi:hypothetical protein